MSGGRDSSPARIACLELKLKGVSHRVVHLWHLACGARSISSQVVFGAGCPGRGPSARQCGSLAKRLLSDGCTLSAPHVANRRESARERAVLESVLRCKSHLRSIDWTPAASRKIEHLQCIDRTRTRGGAGDARSGSNVVTATADVTLRNGNASKTVGLRPRCW